MPRVLSWLVVLLFAAVGRAAITGQVLAPDGRPVAGAAVHLVPYGAAEPAQTVASGPDGRFSLEPPAATVGDDRPPQWALGDVVATAEGYGLGWVGFTRQQLVGELRLSPPTTLAVRCVDGDRLPLPAVAIHVERLNRTGAAPAAWTQLPKRGVAGLAATTDANGAARFSGLPRNVRVDFTVDDHRYAQFFTLDTSRLIGDEAAATVPDLVLTPGAAITGRLLDGRTGRPVAGAELDWRAAHDGAWAEAVTGDDGRYRMDQLPPGVGTLAVTRLPVDGVVAAKSDLSLEEGQELAGQDLTVVEGVPLTIEVKADGRPVPKVEVCVAGPQLPEAIEGTMWLAHVTGVDGRVTVRVLPGKQRIRFDARVAAPEYVSDPGQRRHELVVQAGTPATLAITLERAKAPRGAAVKVVDADGQPAAGARVEVTDWLPEPLTTDAEGRCEVTLEQGPPPQVRAHLGRRRSEGWVAVDPAHDTVLRLAERPWAGVDVLVRDEAGKPLAGIPVTLLEQREGPRPATGQVATNAAGQATFDDVWPGRYVVLAGAEGAGYGRVEADVAFHGARGSAGPLVLKVADQLLAGWVLDPDGKPASGVTVWVTSPDNTSREVKTDAKGEFRFKGLVKGKVQVEAMSGDTKLFVTAEAQTGDDSVVLRLKRRPTRP